MRQRGRGITWPSPTLFAFGRAQDTGNGEDSWVVLKLPRLNSIVLARGWRNGRRRHKGNAVLCTMAENRNTEAAWTYHETTKHSYASIRANPHFLDWANQPLPFKIYSTLELLRLPGKLRSTGVAALSAITESVSIEAGAAPDVGDLGAAPLPLRGHHPA